MLTDLLLAAGHHLLVFALVAMLVTQAILLRGPIDPPGLKRLAAVDAGYGGVAGLLLAVGLLRLFYGIKGYDFYLHNPWFHAKLSAYLLAAVLSFWPTLRFMRWRKATNSDPAFVPSMVQIAGLRRIVRIELVLVAAIFVLAAAMARYGGF